MGSLAYKKPNMQSFIAGADLSAELYTFVKAGTNAGEVVQCGAAEEALGILMDLGQNEGAQGSVVGVAMPGGGGLIKMAAALAPGAKVTADANGEGVAPSTTEFYGAVLDSLGANTASGDYAPCIVVHSFAP